MECKCISHESTIINDAISTSPDRDGIAILQGHQSMQKSEPLAGRGQHLN